MKQLPESFCIAREGRTPENCHRWKRFIEYINKAWSKSIVGETSKYYGAYNRGAVFNGYPFGQLLTLDQFEEIMGWKEAEQWQPKPGEMVQVSTDGHNWYPAEYIAYAEKSITGEKHVVYDEIDYGSIDAYEFCRPIPKVTTYSRSEAIKLLSQHTGKPESEIEITD